MARSLSARKAADQITTLIRQGHYSSPEAVVGDHPSLQPGLQEYKNRQQAAQPSGSGSARLKR